MKKLKWIVIGVVVLVFVVIIGIWLGIDGIVRAAVERQATDSLNLKTTLGGADVSLLGGSLGLSDLQISSPQGFPAPQMFTLGGAKVGVSLSHLKADPIGIDQIVIDKPKLVIEQSDGKFNFQVLMDQPTKAPVDTSKPPSDSRPEGQPVRLVIHDLAVNNAQVILRPGIPGLRDEIVVDVESVHLQEIGSGEGDKNGVAIKEVVMKVITALAQKASESDRVPADVRTLLSLNADQVRARLQGEVNKKIQDLGKDLSPDASKAIQKGVGNLLDRRNDKSSNQK